MNDGEIQMSAQSMAKHMYSRQGASWILAITCCILIMIAPFTANADQCKPKLDNGKIFSYVYFNPYWDALECNYTTQTGGEKEVEWKQVGHDRKAIRDKESLWTPCGGGAGGTCCFGDSGQCGWYTIYHCESCSHTNPV